MTEMPLEAPGERPMVVDQASARKQISTSPTLDRLDRGSGIRLRAALNLCVVRINVAWSSAWAGDQFEVTRPFLDNIDQLRDDWQRLLAELDQRKVQSQAHEALRESVRAAAELISVATAELLDADAPEHLGTMAQRTDRVIAMLTGPQSPTSRSYQAACIHARRYVLLGTHRNGEAWRQDAWRARAAALTELERAVAASDNVKKWARTDPAFRHLLAEREFHLLLAEPGSGAPVPLRRPYVEEPHAGD